MEKLLLPGILLLSLFYVFYQRWLYRDKDDKGPEMIAPATVTAHRVDQGRYPGRAPTRWNYLVTFSLSDGEEIELYTILSDYETLKDGTSGQLTWQGKRLINFEVA
jgi:hypothetical protein